MRESNQKGANRTGIPKPTRRGRCGRQVRVIIMVSRHSTCGSGVVSVVVRARYGVCAAGAVEPVSVS